MDRKLFVYEQISIPESEKGISARSSLVSLDSQSSLSGIHDEIARLSQRIIIYKKATWCEIIDLEL